MPSPSRDFVRHAVATLAYRAAKPLRGAPDSFTSYRVAPGTRSAGEILAHLCDLFDWALSLAEGRERWSDSPPRSWSEDTARFFASLQAFDAYLSSDQPLHAPAEKLFQGPVADALTHVGQLAILRRAVGAPVRGENYFRALITAGQAGLDQPAPVREFD